MINKLIILIFLVLFWWAFSGETDPFFIYAGIFSCLLALWLSVKLGVQKKLVHKIGIFKYIGWLFKEIAVSGFYVARLVWAKKPALKPQFITIETTSKDEVFYAMFANSITMTPGTVTTLIDETHGFIVAHAITDKTAADLKSGDMERKIHEVLK